MQILIYGAIVLFIFATSCLAQEPTWLTKIKQIEPLKSNEKDVEGFFGKPTNSYADVADYELEEGTLSITYSEGRCSSNKESEYDVEKGTVVDVDILIHKKFKFKSLNINLEDFKKEYATGVLDTFFYKNEELGISYEISNGWLTVVNIYPAKDYLDYLSCSQKVKISKNSVPRFLY